MRQDTINIYNYNEARRDPTDSDGENREQASVIPRNVWNGPAGKVSCVCITLRVSAVQCCSTSHFGPAVNRQPGYRWWDSHSSHHHTPRVHSHGLVTCLCAPVQSTAALCNPWAALNLLWACLHPLDAAESENACKTNKSCNPCDPAKPVHQLGSVHSISIDMGLSLGSNMTPKLGYSWPSSKSHNTILKIHV